MLLFGVNKSKKKFMCQHHGLVTPYINMEFHIAKRKSLFKNLFIHNLFIGPNSTFSTATSCCSCPWSTLFTCLHLLPFEFSETRGHFLVILTTTTENYIRIKTTTMTNILKSLWLKLNWNLLLLIESTSKFGSKHVFTRMPCDSYCRQFRSQLLCPLLYVWCLLWLLIISFVDFTQGL